MTDSELDLLNDNERTAAVDARVAAYEEDKDQQRSIMPLAKRDLASVRYVSKWRLMLGGKEAGFRTIDRVNGLDVNVWWQARRWALGKVDVLTWNVQRNSCVAFYQSMKKEAFYRTDVDDEDDFLGVLDQILT